MKTRPLNLARHKIADSSLRANEDYSILQSLDLQLPEELIYLCRLIDVPPRKLIVDLIRSVSLVEYPDNPDLTGNLLLTEYLIEQEKAKDYLTGEDVRQVMEHLQELKMQIYRGKDPSLVDSEYYRRYILPMWFSKWDAIKRMRHAEQSGKKQLPIL